MKKQTQKKFLPALLSLLLGAVLLAVLPTEAEAKIYDDTLRLHILAASDSDEDQAIKLKIRDKILEKYGALLSGAKTLAEAEAIAEKSLPAIEADCNLWLSELGCGQSAVATLSVEWYDTREYENFTLPKGYYASLRILLGEGEGHNWWCVMYPPLCLDMATDAPKDDGYTAEEKQLIGGRYKVKFKILEIFSDLFAQRG